MALFDPFCHSLFWPSASHTCVCPSLFVCVCVCVSIRIAQRPHAGLESETRSPPHHSLPITSDVGTCNTGPGSWGSLSACHFLLISICSWAKGPPPMDGQGGGGWTKGGGGRPRSTCCRHKPILPLHDPAYLSGILLGVLSNARVWCRTWASELLSLTVWLQVATLSGYAGYEVKQVKKAAHSAVVRGLSTSPHDASCTVRYLYDVIPHLPMQRCCAITFCLRWLLEHAHWCGGRYSSWVIPEVLSPNGTKGTWCDDWQILRDAVCSRPARTNQCCDTTPFLIEGEPGTTVCARLKDPSPHHRYQSQHVSSVVESKNIPYQATDI